MAQSPFDLRSPSGTTNPHDPTHPSNEMPPAAPSQRTESPSASLPPDGQAHLVVRRGPDAGTAIALTTPRTAIGRHRDCDIVLEDATVSRRHAYLHRYGDRYVIADGGSLNGTYLNRQPIDRAELSDGDEVWIGKVRFTFRLAP